MVVFLKLAVAAGIILLIVWKVGFAEAIAYTRQISPQGISLVLGLMIFQLILAAFRQQRVARIFESPLGMLTSLQITFVGSFFSQTFISVIGGDMSRVWLLVRQGISVGVAGCIVAFDRLNGLMANHLMVLVALPWLLAIFVEPAARAAVIAVAVAGTVVSVGLLAAGFWGSRVPVADWLPKSLGERRFVRGVIHLITVKRPIFVHPVQAGLTTLLSLAIAALNCLIIYVLFHDLGAQVSLLYCFVLVPLLMEVAALPISIGGWGLREAVVVLGFGALGVPHAQALLVSILFGLCGVATGAIGGVIWLAMRHETARPHVS